MIFFLALIGIGGRSILQTTPVTILPTPQRIELHAGESVLNHPVIVYEPGCKDVATVLAEEIQAKTGVRVGLSTHTNGPAIFLRLSRRRVGHLPGVEEYMLDSKGSVIISAPTRQALNWGAVSLLQLVKGAKDQIRLPKLGIDDFPSHPFRCVMVDVARQYHSLPVLKQCVELAHLYKFNYLQLHLSDDQSFMFPSTLFPEINSQNQNKGQSYTVAELKDLVSYADKRGVEIVPEMDIPGHSATLLRTLPQLFKIKSEKPYALSSTINFADPKVLSAIDTLIGEICSVFSTSPYFHMGGDEADLSGAGADSEFQKAFLQLGIKPSTDGTAEQELFRHFIGQVDELVKKRGKKLLVWEGFGRSPRSQFKIPKDVTVMEFENAYYLPTDLLNDGYKVINASWTPLYVVKQHVWPVEKILDWDLTQFGRFSRLYKTTEWIRTPTSAAIQGASVCSWEGPEELEIQNLRRIVPAVSERIWHPERHPDRGVFARKLAADDEVLDNLIHPVRISFSRPDAKDPNDFDLVSFTKPLTATLSSSRSGNSIHYTLTGELPTVHSAAYKQPLTFKTTTTLRASLFATTGQQIGFESAQTFYHVPEHPINLAVGKKVIVSGGTQGAQTPDLVVDDSLDLGSSWWAGPAPQWLQIDLAKPEIIDRIEVFPYWDGSRYYQYTVQVSKDAKSWVTVADRSLNTKPATEFGDDIRFASRLARYIRVNMLKGSANEAVHLVEVRVWPTARP